MRKMVSFLLTLVLTAGLLPAKTMAAQSGMSAGLENVVGQQFDAFVKQLDFSNADDAAVRVLVNNSLEDKPRDLYFGAGDAVTATVLNSRLFRETFVETVSQGLRYAYELRQEDVYLGGSAAWYKSRKTYSCRVDDKEIIREGATDVSGKLLISTTYYTGSVNEYDDSLCLVIGSGYFTINLEKAAQTDGELVYDVTIKMYDDFEFSSNYTAADDKGYDTDNEKFINWIARLFGLNEFHWELEVEGLRLTVPYSCAHTLENCAWTYDGTALQSDTGGFTENTASRVTAYKSDGTAYNPYFKLERAMQLFHNKPWVVEMRSKGGNGMILSSGESYTNGRPYLLRTSQHIVGGQYFTYKEYDPEKGKEVTRSYRDQYGVRFTELGFKVGNMQTYRMENRVAEDGSNMVWLSIDGQEIGPMDRYFLNINGVNTDMEVEEDWFSGTDFQIRYVGNKNFGFVEKLEIESIKILEYGVGGDNSAFVPSGSGDEYTCALCGLTRWENEGATVCRDGETLQVELADETEAQTVMAAAYDETGRMTGMTMAAVVSGKAELTDPGQHTKLFFLDGEQAPVLSCLEL